MKIQLHHIAGGKRLLGQGRPEEFVDHSYACDPNGALLLAGLMCRHDHAAGHPIRSHWDPGQS